MKRVIAAVLLAFVASQVWSAAGAADGLPPPKRPLVFIPGIIGSELWSGNERLWGGLSDITHVGRLAIDGGPRDIPPLNTCSVSDSNDQQKRETCGPVESFSTLPPFSVDQYAPFFRFLESLGYSRQGPDKNLFVFSYDWRRSNFQTAEDFAKFVDSQSGLVGKPFDILAHSMGGLVAIIFTNKYDASPPGLPCSANTCRVQTVISLGTPYWGSMSSLSTLDTGWGEPWNWIAGGQETIRKTVLSWPSVYEMLPSYEDCCFRRTSGNERVKMDLSQYEQWQALPFSGQTGERLEANVKAALDRNKELRNLTRNGFPPHITRNPGPCDPSGNRFFAITGDHFDTGSEFELENGRLRYIARRGDDTVLVRSSNMGDVGRAFISFTNHRKIFADEHVQSQIKDILLRCDLNIKNFSGPSVSVELQLSNGGAPVTAALYTVAVTVNPAVLRQGEAGRISVKLDFETYVDAVAPKGKLSVTMNGKLIFSDRLDNGQKASTSDGNRIAFEYTSSTINLREAGAAIVSVEFPDIGEIQTEALVLP